MENNTPFNIFDEASRKKSAPPIKKAPTTSAPPAPSSPSAYGKNATPIEDPEVAEIFARMRTMQQDLMTKVDQVKQNMPLTQSDVVSFLNSPTNFTPEQWTVLQANRQDLETKLSAIMGTEVKKVKQAQQEDKDSKARKGKTMGARRNWIPIR